MPNTSTRSRIEGTLHRSLPASLTIRAAEPGQADDGLLRLRLSVSSEQAYLRSSWWDDPWVETLGHKDGEIDLTRFNGGATVLANHNRYAAIGNTPLAGIGKIEKAWTEGGRLMADIAISRREALADLRQDIADDLVNNVSIGYTIEERLLTKAGSGDKPNEYRVTKWTPFEVSLVDIPADHTVGLGRSATDDGPAGSTPGTTTSNQATRQPMWRVVDLPPAEGTPPHHQRSHMPQANNAPAEPTSTAPAATTVPAQARSAPDTLASERERVREITALGRQFGLTAEADKAVDDGTALDGFRQLVLQRQQASGKIKKAESSEIGMSKREVEQFSFCRALLAAADPMHAASLAPFEMECSRAAQDKRGNSRDKTREAALTIPIDVLSRGIHLGDDGIGASLSRQFMQRSRATGMEAYRDLVVGTATSGGHTVATELFGSSFIELLRHAMIMDRLGITWLRDLNGNIAIPSQTGAATSYWVAENGAPTESQQTIGQVTMTPKTVGAYTDYSRRLLLQSSIDVEAFVRADLSAIIGQAIQLAAINGSGSSNEPTGLLNTSGIGSVAIGTDGGAPTRDHMVDLETAVGNANADVGNMAYLTNSRVRGKLRKTQEFSGTNGKAVWDRGTERGIGDILGYDAWVTNSVPNALTKGSNSDCSAVMFGNWADMMIGMWGGLDIMLDPYTLSTAGAKRVVAFQDLDIKMRRVESFAAIKDARTV